MTAVFNHTATSSASDSSSASADVSPAGLIDQVAEAVTYPPDSHTRSVVIASLIAEIFETLRWLHGSEPDQDELSSLYRVLAEAYAHRSRMAARTVVRERR